MQTNDEAMAVITRLKELQVEFHTVNAQHLDPDCEKTTDEITREVELARKRVMLCALNIDCDVVLRELA